MKTEKNIVRILKQTEVKSAVIKLRSDGIMQFEIKPGDEFTVADLIEVNASADILGECKKFPRLIIMNHFVNFGKDVREVGATEENNQGTIAAAFLIKVLALKYVGNFYILFNKPIRPSKLFDKEEKAVEWLKTFL